MRVWIFKMCFYLLFEYFLENIAEIVYFFPRKINFIAGCQTTSMQPETPLFGLGLI